jgi:two-component system, cell cycle sensor histidine kinase and response regulator CckA
MRRSLQLVLPCLLQLSAGVAGAQVSASGGVDGARAPLLLRDYTERRFAGPDGLQSLAVYAVELVPDGTLWIGTEAGPHRMVGARFEHVPIPLAITHVRAIVQTRDGAVWFGTRLGVVRRAPNGVMTVFGEEQGVPQGTVYSLVLTTGLDGTERLVAATSSGLAFLADTTWQRLPLPNGMRPDGLVLSARPRAGQPDELWLGGANGQAARWADGTWSSVYGLADGLAVRALERFLVVDDSSRTLFAATDRGVFRFADDGGRGRWGLVPGSPAYAYRMAWVPNADGTRALWVGTLDGLLLRQRGARWDTISLRSTDPRTPLHALLGVSGHAGGFGLYVGTFGDGLVRLSVGRAATLVSPSIGLRLSIPAVLEEPLGEPGTAWMSTSGFGVVEIGPRGARTVLDRDGSVDGRVNALFGRRLADGRHEVWAGAANGLRQYVNGRWHVREMALGPVLTTGFSAERLDDPSSPVLAATIRGVHAWRDTTWERLAGTPTAQVWSVLGESARDARVWIAGPFGTMVRRGGAWRTDTSHFSLGNRANIRAFCRMETDTGVRVLMGSGAGLAWQSARDSVWSALPQRLRAPLSSENVYGLRCDDPSRVLVATAGGLVVYDLHAADPAQWELVTMLGPADGMPSPIAQAIGQGGAPGARWIGTAQGLGRVDLGALPVPGRTTLMMQLLQGTDDAPLEGAAVIPFAENRVTVRLQLPTFHREEDLRYHIELTGPTAVPTSAWLSASEVSYAALAPGDYTIRARARDYAGREYGPLEQRFRIAYPPWRSPLAFAVYGLLLIAGAASAHRWRLHTIRGRAAQLEASERRVRASEAQFRALFDRAHDASLLVRDGRIALANASAAALLGEPIGALEGRPLPAWNAPDVLSTADGAAWETQLVWEDRAPVPVAISVSTVSRDDGRLQHWVLRDLSAARDAEMERRSLESQVREAQKLESLGTLAGGVAHDFNNLLGVIRGNAELARESLHDPDEVADHLSAVLDASERARDLVRQILTFSRRSAPHESVVDLGAVVRALVPMLRSLIPRTVELTVRGGDGTYPVRGDLTQLQQLLFNLCSNAEYAMRPTNGGRLEIHLDSIEVPEAFADGSHRAVSVRVRDSGVGMSESVRARVFEPFFTTKPTGEGTGLGLSVLHGIVVSHGGRVRVESAEGEGTTFEVHFPLLGSEASAALAGRVATAPPPSGPAAPSAPDVCTGAQVVLVDDEPSVARVVERALTRLGCRVRTFSDPREALAHVERRATVVDLVVTDQTMPGLTGDDLAEAAHRARPGLPVILVTGYSYRLTAERLAAVGATAVLQKPVPLELLTRTVREALAFRTPNDPVAR